MSASTQPTREFPALLMTLLVIGASLASTGCLRIMAAATQPSPSYLREEHHYFASTTKLDLAIEQAEQLKLEQDPPQYLARGNRRD